METARDIYDWVGDAMGDMAYGAYQMYEENNDGGFFDEQTKHIKKLIKEGVTDIPGRLADDYYNDPDLLADLIGDKVYDASHESKEIRLRLLEELKEIGHDAMKQACSKIIRRTVWRRTYVRYIFRRYWRAYCDESA